MTLDDARPLRRAVKVLANKPLLTEGTRWLFRALHADTLLVEEIDHQANVSRGLVLRSMTSPDGAVRVPDHAGRAGGVTAADLSSKFVVWMESSSQELAVAPWTLFAFNRRTHDVARLSAAPRIDGDTPAPSVPGYTGPTLSETEVFWAQVGGRPGAETVSIRGCVVLSCSPRLVAAGAALPSASGQDLYFVTGKRFAGKRNGAGYAIEHLNLRTGKRRVIRRLSATPDVAPSGLAASGHHVIVTMGGPQSDYVEIINTRTGSITQFTSAPGTSLVYPDATRRFVVWADGNSSADTRFGGYLWDFKERQLYSVGNTPGLYQFAASGSTLVWQESDGPKPQDIRTVVGDLK